MKAIVNGIEIDLTAEEIKARELEIATYNNGAFARSMESLRFKRNKLLLATDYLALSDQTLTDEMKKYRQDLRDITEGLTTVEDVKAVTFPTKP